MAHQTNAAIDVVVVMVPLPAEGQLNQFLQLSCLLAARASPFTTSALPPTIARCVIARRARTTEATRRRWLMLRRPHPRLVDDVRDRGGCAPPHCRSVLLPHHLGHCQLLLLMGVARQAARAGCGCVGASSSSK
ncbi:zeatin O-glucosyltransferase-like [Canna indica]|uniref:Zeatin O-glucosyltransferase-like n=1 Tax=Canna indica TaxID=4628 RepID=A0AAQ3KGH1_9LILI|nr:zeatin O-glucosyltransferase-like [Canna indica]